jgi:uroporphyrinogen-III synthase
MTSALSLLRLSSGNKRKIFLLRPIYLISKTSYDNAVDVTHIPILSIKYLQPKIDFSLYDGIIVTSKEGARALQNYKIDWTKLDILCVGDSTANEIGAMGGCNITIAAGYGDSILEVLEDQYNRWLYIRPRAIASSWPQKARLMGKKIDEVIIYETTCDENLEKMQIAHNGVLIFTSPSSIECFRKYTEILPTHGIIVIGTTTQKALPLGIKSLLSEETSVISCIEKAREIADS